MAGRTVDDVASGLPDPIQRAAARRVLAQQASEAADPLAEYRIPDEEWAEAEAAMAPPPSAPFSAAAKGAYQALTLPARALSKIGGENSLDALARRKFPERSARVDELQNFRPRGTSEELGYGAGKLATEAATLFTPAGAVTGSLMQRAAGTLLKRAATNLPGRIATKAVHGAGTFGIADAARDMLERQATGTPQAPMETLKKGARGAVAGAALGPAGAIPSTLLRIPAEAVTMAGVSAAEEGRLPNRADVGMNLALFTMLHGIAKVPGKLSGFAAQVEILKDAFQQGRQAGADARELTDAINDMSPEVVDAVTRAINNPEAGDVRAAAFGDLDPKLAHSLEEARGLLAEARAGTDPAEVTRAEHGVRTVIREIDRANPTLVKEWNDAVDAARALRGGAPAVPPGAETAPGATQGPETLLAGGEKAHVEETEPVDRRERLQTEGDQLRQELETGGLGPDQEAATESRLQAIRNELAALPEPAPSVGDVAATTIEPTLEAVDRANLSRFEPTEPTTQELRPNQMRRALGDEARGLSPQEMTDRLNVAAPPEIARAGPSRGVRPERGKPKLMERPGGLSFADMPQTIEREARPEVRRVLAEQGIKGKRRKALMQGPDLWRRAAWEYYKATGKLPGKEFPKEARHEVMATAGAPSQKPAAPPELPGTRTITEKAKTTTQADRSAPVHPSEKRAEPRSPLAVHLHSAVARAERAETPKLQKEAYRVAHQAVYDELHAFMRRERIPTDRTDLAFARSERLNELNDRLDRVQSAIFTREMAEQDAARPPIPREPEAPTKAKLVPKRTEDGGVRYVAEPIEERPPTPELPELVTPAEEEAAFAQTRKSQASAAIREGQERRGAAAEGITEPKKTPTFTFRSTTMYGKRALHYWTADIDMPDGGGKAGSLVSAEVIARNGFDVPPVPGEPGGLVSPEEPKTSPPTPQFKVGDVVISNGATLVVKDVRVAQVFDPVDKKLKDRVLYDLEGATGRGNQYGVDERGVMPSAFAPSTEVEKQAAPTLDDILAGKANTRATIEEYEKARATLRELAKGLKINAGINADALAALFKIGEFHVERLLRAGAHAGKDLYDRWASAIRLELEDVDATISDDRLRWMWDNPDIKQAVAAVEKEAGHAAALSEDSGAGEKRPSEPGGARRPAQGSTEERPAPPVPGGARSGATVGEPRHEPRGGGARGEPRGPSEAAVPGDRDDALLREDVRLDRSKPVELTPAKRKAANAEAERIVREKTAAQTTAADREALRQYTGAGGLQGTEGRGFLWQHYTSYPVVDFIWKKLRAMGWKGGNVLEPAAAVGNFIGFKPEGASIDAVELDPTAAEIARRLYPKQKVTTGPFETFRGKAGGYDLVIGNPPFSEKRGRLRYAPEASAYRDVETLHDFFVAKGIDHLKPGGTLAYVISTGFMDKLTPDARKAIAEKADLVAAYRLPSGVFDKNADYAGAVDVVIFQRRPEGVASTTKPDWIESTRRETGGRVNEYWDKHPDNVLGTMEAGYKQKHADQMGVRGEFTEDVEHRILGDETRIQSYESAKPAKPKAEAPSKKTAGVIDIPADVQMGQHFLLNHKLYVATSEGGVAYTGPIEAKVKSSVMITDTLARVRAAMLAGEDGKVKLGQTVLRKLLDGYSATAQKANPEAQSKAWFKNDKTLNRVLGDDPNLFTLRALINDDGTYADIVTKPTIYSSTYGKKPKNLKDFNVAALEVERRYGEVSEANFRQLYTGSVIDFDAAMRKRPEWNRTAGGWMHDSDYLHGELRPRMDEARALGLPHQVEKLRAVLPPQETAASWVHDLSASWIDPEIIEKFGSDVLGVTFYKVRDRYEKQGGGSYGWDNSLYVGKQRFERPKVDSWYQLVLDRLNGRQFKPLPPKFDADGRMTSEGMSKKEAVARNAAVKEMDKVFDAWAVENRHKDGLVDAYNRRFRSWRQKEYSTDFEIDGFSNQYFKRIHPWQARVANWLFEVGRGINSLGTGGGKTLSFILLGQKLKQEGLARKPLYVVPSKTITKWCREYNLAFPDAKVLNLVSLTGETNSPRKRYELLQRAALNEWDAVVMSYEGFKEIPMSEAATAGWFEGQIQKLRDELNDVPVKDRKSKRSVEQAILALEEKLAKALEFDRTRTIDFEKLGVDAILVDEAHNFKNLPTASTGLASQLNMGGGDAQRAIDLAMKTDYILKRNGNRNVYFASATPTPNAPIEIYTMTSFLAPDVWEEKGIKSLHGFLSTFADVALKATSDVAGGYKEKNVIVGFKDFQTLKPIRERFIYMRSSAQMRAEYPTYEYREPEGKIETVVLDPSPSQQEAIGRILAMKRAGPAIGENPWTFKSKLLVKARKVAIHAGLFSPAEWENDQHPNNKLIAIADRTAAAYHEHKANPPRLPDDADPNQPALNGHAIFLDLYGKEGNPPMARNLYKHLIEQLVSRGVPREEIAVISGSENAKPREKAKVAENFNDGKIRVVIGNTQSMGEGMDLQRIGTNLTHWDATWNPSGMRQREGRMVRQGNPADEVQITRFVTRGTTDQFMYGKLAQKQKWEDSLWERDQNYVKNEGDEDPGSLSLDDIERVLDPGEHTTMVFEAKDETSLANANLKLQQAQVLENSEKLAKINAEIADREMKVAGYLGKQAQSKEGDVFQHTIDQHNDALADLRKAKAATAATLEAVRGANAMAEVRAVSAAKRLAAAERIRDRVVAGDSFGTAVAKQELEDFGLTAPEGYSSDKLAEAIKTVAEADDDATRRAELEAVATRIRAGTYPLSMALTGDWHRGTAIAHRIGMAWKSLYGDPPVFPKPPEPRNVGAASGREMGRALRAERRLLVQQAKELGITAPVQTPAPEAKGPRMERTARPSTARELDEVERERIGGEGTLSEKDAAKLGRRAIDPAEYEKLSQGEKVVHVMRRVEAARDPKHLDNILASKKFKVWTWSKGDQAALATAIGLRTVGMGYDEAPPELRAALKRSDAAAAEDVEQLRAETKKWVFSLFPAEHNLGGLNIVEGHGGMREAFQVIAHEKQLWDQHAKTHFFRDPKGKLMKRLGPDDRIIFELANNAKGDDAGIDRPTVTLQDGTELTPEPWHRERAREWQKFYNEFADRQELPDERRIPNYMHHIIDRRLSLEPATRKDLFAIHQAARTALEANYDAAELNKLLPKDLKRNKALQILDVLHRQKGNPGLKWLKRRVDVILAADESVGIPRELFIPHLQRRRGGTPYLESAIDSFQAYVPYALRKIYLEPAVLAAKPVIEAMNERGSLTFLGVGVQSRRAYAEDYINSVLGRPSASDRGLDSLMAGFNDATKGHLLKVPVLWRLFKPNLATRSISALTRIQYLRLLGLAVDSAITNVTQGVNTLAEFGLRDTFKGYLRLADPRFWKELHQEKLLGEYKQMFTGPIAPWEHPLNLVERVALSPFTFAEFVNRGAAFAAGLSRAKREGLSFERSQQMGLGAVSRYLMENPVKARGALDRVFGAPEASKVYTTSPGLTKAREGVLKTQFGYSPAESAPVLRTPSGRFMFQFWNYPTRQSSMIVRGLQSGMKNGEYMQFARFLALLGATVTAPLLWPSLKNLWSVWSLWPRNFGPNATMSYLLWQSITGDKDAGRKLERQLYLKGGGLRFFDKVARHGEDAVLPLVPPKQPTSRPRSYRHGARPSRRDRPSHAYGGPGR